MMLTIHGIPMGATYKDIKRLVKQECSINDFILDNLVTDDDGCKKVRIGVNDDSDGSQLMKFLNGYNLSGNVIRVVPVGKPAPQNQSSFDARGGYQPRNDFHPSSNFGAQPMHDNQPRPNTWTPNMQWPAVSPQLQQNSFVNQPQPTIVNSYVQQQPRVGFPSGRTPAPIQQTPQQNFRFAAKGNIERTITVLKDNFQGPGQYEPPVAQGHFQSQPHVQPSPWNQQVVQPVKPQFDKPAPGFNQTGFNDRQVSKVSVHESGYKNYDKGDHRYDPHMRGPSPGRRMSPRRKMSPESARRMSPSGLRGHRLVSPGPPGRRMSPTGPQGRRMSPSGPQGRRMSPSGRRISPTGRPSRRMSPTEPRQVTVSGAIGRRMSPTGPHSRGMDPVGPQGRRMSPGPPGRRISPGPQGRRMSPGLQARRVSPPGPHGRRMSPPGPHGRRMSPGPMGRRISPPGPHHGRRMSPSGIPCPPERRMSPGRTRRISPPRMGGPVPIGRGMSPTEGRRMSPSRMGGHGDIPHGRKVSPGPPGRRVSPGRRMSPGIPGRHNSPDRRISPGDHRGRTAGGRRASPPRASGRRSPPVDAGPRGYPSYPQTKKSKYDDDERAPLLKQVRPAYEPSTKAPNQAMYSGGYRPNVHENVQYPAPSARPDPWQQGGDKPAPYPKPGDGRVEKFDIPRGSDHLRMGEGEPKRSRSANRDSRSPVRRDRSPLKDRYRRHSPSPRSPRRSWALEKRRSPDMRDAPPPPLWPGQNARETEFPRARQVFPDVAEKIEKKHPPSWEPPIYDEREDPSRRAIPARQPVHADKWKPMITPPPVKEPLSSGFRQDERYSDNVRDSRNYPPKEDYGRPSDTHRMPYPDKRDFRDFPMKKDDREEPHYKKDVPLRREDFLRSDDLRRDALRTNPAELNKEIEDVYKRVAELGKKAQEFRKKESRFEDRGDQFFVEDSSRGRDDRRDFVDDGRFQARDEEVRSRHSDEAERPRSRESRWSNTDVVWRPRKPLSAVVKAKREKATEELVRRTMNRFKNEIGDQHKDRVRDELSLTFSRIFYDMFKDEDVSYIELIIRFNKKFDSNDEAKIFEDVMSSFSSGYRKRVAQDEPPVPAKTSKRSDDLKDIPKDVQFQSVTGYKVPEWNYASVPPPVVVAPPLNPLHAPNLQMQYVVNPASAMIVNPRPPCLEPSNLGFEPMQPTEHKGYNLFLCKDGFLPFEEHQAGLLKSFLISQMMDQAGKSTDGWAPDFIMKGLQNLYRYQIVTQDERSRDWLLDLDFSNFSQFNVLVYTGEELWYERAAIWLPGHSRCRHIEPLNKLKLQNKKLEGVQIGKWKFVRKVVTTNGTRIYVDMPPSSARALEKYKMMLSYELQKVSVFLKSAAVDKDAFDAGLQEHSIEYVPSIENCPMPSLSQDTSMVKIGIKGKQMNLNMARRIKYMIIYKLYQYHQQGGTGSTDFLKYGFCSPGYLGIVPENTESRRWLVGLNIGSLRRSPIVVIGGDETNMKYIGMSIMLPNRSKSTLVSAVCEKLKQSNQGVKGLNFGAWKNAKLFHKDGGRIKLEVDMDLESVETLVSLDYELDYVDEGQESLTVVVDSEYSRSELEEIIKKYHDEMTDTYDETNMDLESQSSDDDVICLD